MADKKDDKDEDPTGLTGDVKVKPEGIPAAYPGEPKLDLDKKDFGDQSNNAAAQYGENQTPAPTQINQGPLHAHGPAMTQDVLNQGYFFDKNGVGAPGITPPMAAPTLAPAQPQALSEAPAEQATDQNSEMANEQPSTPPQPAPKPDPDAKLNAIAPVAPVSQILNDQIQFSQALENKEIKPETINSLYAKKDTPGRIGMLFGLLVGGLGAGLTKQPSTVMEMLKNEIANDLDAQKTMAANRITWSTLASQHVERMAQANKSNAEAVLQLQKATTETGIQEEQRQKIQQMIKEIEKQTLNNSLLSIAVHQHMQNIVNDAPDGSTLKTVGQQALDNVVTPAISGSLQKDAIDGNAKAQAVRAMGLQQAQQDSKNNQPEYTQDNDIDYKKLESLREESKRVDSLKVPGLTSKASPDEMRTIDNQVGDVQGLRSLVKSYTENYNDLISNVNIPEGQWLNQRQKYIDSLKPLIGTAMKNTGHTKVDIENALFPQNYRDIFQDKNAKLKAAYRMFNTIEAGMAPLATSKGIIKKFRGYDLPKNGNKEEKSKPGKYGIEDKYDVDDTTIPGKKFKRDKLNPKAKWEGF